MSEKLREALSAAVDGEASEFELRRVFDELAKDDGLMQAWSSYHLIKQAAHGENVEGVAAMGDRIWASLDAEQFLEQDIVQEEPSVETADTQPKRGFQIAGGAIAAALALGVFLASGFLDDSEPAGPAINSISSVEQPVEINPSDQPVDVNDMYLTPPPSADQGSAQTVALDIGSGAGSGAGADVGNSRAPGEEYDYGPGFIPYDELSAADKARADGYFLHHVQHQAVNNENVLSFVKMISFPQ